MWQMTTTDNYRRKQTWNWATQTPSNAFGFHQGPGLKTNHRYCLQKTYVICQCHQFECQLFESMVWVTIWPCSSHCSRLHTFLRLRLPRKLCLKQGWIMNCRLLETKDWAGNQQLVLSAKWKLELFLWHKLTIESLTDSIQPGTFVQLPSQRYMCTPETLQVPVYGL